MNGEGRGGPAGSGIPAQPAVRTEKLSVPVPEKARGCQLWKRLDLALQKKPSSFSSRLSVRFRSARGPLWGLALLIGALAAGRAVGRPEGPGLRPTHTLGCHGDGVSPKEVGVLLLRNADRDKDR